MSLQSTESSRTWFCVLNIHCLYTKDDSELYTDNMTTEQKEKRLDNATKLRKMFRDMTPEEIVDSAIERWIFNKPQRTCAVNYEIGDNGNEHLHLVLCDPAKSRFSAVLKKYPGIHCEITRGNRQQVMDYICKKGRFEEKEHTVVVPARFYGNISGKTGSGNSCLAVIEELIEQGKKPSEIFDISIEYRKYEKIVRDAFFAKRIKETPPLRDVKVVWHIGKSGTGKTYSFVKLCEQYGEDEIYLMTDYSNNCTGSFDLYCAEKILFMDEFKGQMPFYSLLLLLQGYKSQIHARYANAYGLWTEVHITSVLAPEQCYKNMVLEDDRKIDNIKQLVRRIDTIVFHMKKDGEYLTFEMPMEEYTDYNDLYIKALKSFGVKEKSYPVMPLEGWQ